MIPQGRKEGRRERVGVLEIKRHIGLQTNTQGAKQMLLQPNEFVVQFLSPLCRCVKTIPHSPSVCHLVCACVCVCVCVCVRVCLAVFRWFTAQCIVH